MKVAAARNFEKSRGDSLLITAARYASMDLAMSKLNREVKSENLKKDPRTWIAEESDLAGQIPCFDLLPDTAFVRQSQLVRDPKHPTRPAPLPLSSATFWRWIRDGKFPQPIKLGARVTAWKVGDVRAWLKSQAAQGAA